MKLLIKYAGRQKRLVIETSPSTEVAKLKKEIKKKSKIFLPGFRLFFTIFPAVKVLLTDSFPLSFFGISQGCTLELDIFGSSSLKSRIKCRNSIYLNTIGLSVKYYPSQFPVFESLLDFIHKGDAGMFVMVSERYIKENPDEDLLNKTELNMWSSLHYSCFYGHTEIVTYLISRQVNVNRITIDFWTPLQLACFMEHPASVSALAKHKNLQYNKATKLRGTALHLSCEKNNVGLVRTLIKLGAFVVIKDPMGFTPFDLTNNKEILDELDEAARKEKLRRAEDDRLEGMCTKLWMSRPFFIHDQQVILDMDIQKGHLHRYDIETYQSKGKPEISVNLSDIQNVQEDTNWFFSNREEYYFTVETTKSSYRYYDRMHEPIREWVKRLQKAVEYFIIHPNKISELDTPQEPSDRLEINDNQLYTQGDLNISCFEELEALGQGSFGLVSKVKLKPTNEIFALKVINRRNLIKFKQLKYAVSEIKIMKRLKHPFILTLHNSFEDKQNIYMVLEYCPNGDLSDLIRKKGKFDIKQASFYLSEIILALEYLHSRDIIYRDLKPANVLLDAEGHIRLADFGLAKENIGDFNPAMTFAGTPAYLPPETLTQRGTSKPADIYGLGVILYEMLTGKPPFFSLSMEELMKGIRAGNLQFPAFVTEPAREFILATMNRFPERRPNIYALRCYSLFYKRDWDRLAQRKIKPPRMLQTNVSMEQEDFWEI